MAHWAATASSHIGVLDHTRWILVRRILRESTIVWEARNRRLSMERRSLLWLLRRWLLFLRWL